MIKHIKRKTVLYTKISADQLKDFPTIPNPKEVLSNLKFNSVKRQNVIQLMEDGEILLSFFYNDNGKACTIPLANPVLIYFNIAQSHLRTIYSTKDDLLGLFRNKQEVNEDAMKLFYDFFGLTSSFITMLMTSLEAFVNQKIDKSIKYEKPEHNKYLRVYDYDQILRWVSFEEKINDILDKQHSKSFTKKFPNRFVHIKNLKEIRDKIVHTKQGKDHQGYIDLFRQSLNFKFSETIEAVQDFINYYEEGLIEPCPCGVDL